MSVINFVSTGNAEQDETEAVRIQQRESLLSQGMCPNRCGKLMDLSPWDRDCPKCGFLQSSNVPFHPELMDGDF